MQSLPKIILYKQDYHQLTTISQSPSPVPLPPPSPAYQSSSADNSIYQVSNNSLQLSMSDTTKTVTMEWWHCQGLTTSGITMINQVNYIYDSTCIGKLRS